MASTSAAVSHVGKIRSNNQDSGYAGTRLFMVADGMGGHAGGDVASAIATKRISEVDQEYDAPHDAEYALQDALLSANSLLAETVFEHGELTGMGTTVSALVRVRDRVVLAHIGDSRVYLFRDGELSQITTDHTFVQRLVDSGRITPEEAAVHPRRSVLMRVLGDVDANPEIDTIILDTRAGDRWVMCSDGLSSYVAEERIRQALANVPGTKGAADRLLKEALDHGAPDNVTVVILDVDDTTDPPSTPPAFVGSSAAPLSFEPPQPRRSMRLPSLLLHPLKSTQEDAHFEPESDEFLNALIEEDRRRHRRRQAIWITVTILAIAAGVGLVALAYQWTQSHYYVGDDSGVVAIYQGVQQGVGPISLSEVYETTDIELVDLPDFTRNAVQQTISADDLADAREIVDRLQNQASGG